MIRDWNAVSEAIGKEIDKINDKYFSSMINIDELIKQAMKSKNKTELEAYKNIKVEIQKNQTAKGAKPLTDESQLQIISKYAKSLEDAIKQFSEARRDDLVAEYTNEWEVVKKLLPEPVNESQIEYELGVWCGYNDHFVIKEDKSLANAIPKKEMGTVIKHLKSKFPTADGKMISEIVKKYLV